MHEHTLTKLANLNWKSMRLTEWEKNVREALSLPFPGSEDPGLAMRRRVLRKAFGALKADLVPGILPRLGMNGVDPFATSFHKLHRATRHELESILRRKIASPRGSTAGHADADPEPDIEPDAAERSQEDELVRQQQASLFKRTGGWLPEEREEAQALVDKYTRLRARGYDTDYISSWLIGYLKREYERYLRMMDAANQEHCRNNPPGNLAKVWGDPCAPIMSNQGKLPAGWGKYELNQFEQKLWLRKDGDAKDEPSAVVLYAYNEFRARTNPKAILNRVWSEGLASALVGVAGNVMTLAAVGAGRLQNRRLAAVVGGAGNEGDGGGGSTTGPRNRKYPQGAMSEEYAKKVGEEALRQSEWLRELRAIKGIKDTKAQYEAISSFIKKYERGTGIKIEVVPAERAGQHGLTGGNWGRFAESEGKIYMHEAVWTRSYVDTLREIGHEVGAAELCRILKIGKDQIPAVQSGHWPFLTQMIDALL